jgi:hypothetical protein
MAVSDYAQTSATNNITIGRNGSNIGGDASDLIMAKKVFYYFCICRCNKRLDCYRLRILK